MKQKEEKPTIIRRNINNQIYDFLKYKILTQEYAPGERLHIDQLREKLGVSSTPIKDALNKLAGEGLVESVPRGGVFVTNPSKREMKESFDVRLMMETYAIECALKRKIQRKEIDVLKKFLSESAGSIKNNDYKRFMEKDREFHYLLVKMSNNRKLCDLYRQLNIHMQIARSYYVRNYKRLQENQKEHEKILNALTKQDPDLTKECLTAHIMTVKRSVMRKEGIGEKKEHLKT
jgi:DNA-binding GntR family transcriptional regulator